MQMIQANFMMIFLNFMVSNGFEDYEGAGIRKYMFLAMLLFAVPIGLYLKNKKLLPIIRFGSYLTPLAAAGLLITAYHHQIYGAYFFAFFLGTSNAIRKLPILPYLIVNVKKENQITAIALNFVTWSAASIVVSIFNKGLQYVHPIFQEDYYLFLVTCGLSILGIPFFLSKMPDKVEQFEKLTFLQNILDYDWKKIFKATLPGMMIAMGAGITIPNISVFFLKIHHVSSADFSVIGGITSVLVFFAGLLVPSIKSRFGIYKAVFISQGIAILALATLATTEFYSLMSGAALIAAIAYVLRQPTMNLAHPITSEFAMNFVGEKNQQIITALDAAIWGGTWFLSSYVFEILRAAQVDYAYIFYLTCLLYVFGSFLFYRLTVIQKKSNQ